MLRVLLIAFLLTSFSSNVKSQKEIIDFLGEASQNSALMINGYLEPLGNMVGRSLSGGWYNSAEVHKPLGFEIKFGASASLAPESAKTFDIGAVINQFEGDGYTLKDPSNHMAQTIAGSSSATNNPVIQKYEEDVITTPKGAGLSLTPIPYAQVTLGIPFHTDLSVRFLPKFDIYNIGSVGLYGFGVKHSFKEYIPVFSDLPFVNTSVVMGYTKLNNQLSFNVNDLHYNLDLGSNALIARLLVGVDVPFISIYSGLGYGSYSTDYVLSNENDPKLSSGLFKNSTVDFNVGARLKLGFLTIHGDYNLGDYAVVSAGVGISFR